MRYLDEITFVKNLQNRIMIQIQVNGLKKNRL